MGAFFMGRCRADKISANRPENDTKYRRKKRRLATSFFWNIGTEDGTRTHKPVRALPPQGSVSTNSTTSVQILLLVWDIAGRLSRFSWLSLLSFRRSTQIFPLASFTGLVAVDITQRQTDNEEQCRQNRR